ncbi:hypothetical protein EZS27_016422 [termite gut metagenome]|uniref:Uncharacterized protein n=1 Tax=termite gut metagenome TaxID=433724 RepID=A0A5J4RPA4_9ZZZZ
MYEFKLLCELNLEYQNTVFCLKNYEVKTR